jgi:hypothetical protein
VAFERRPAGPGGTLVAQGTFTAVLPVDHPAAGSGGIDLAFGDPVEAWAQVLAGSAVAAVSAARATRRSRP